MSAALSVGAWPSSSGASLGQESEDGQSMLRAFAPSYYLMVVFLLSALLYGMLLALRVHAFPVGDRRFFWIPSVFLVGALVVASASLGSSKFGELRAGAIDPALAWTRRRLNILRGDAYVLMLLAYAALLLFAYLRYGVLFQFSLGMYALMTLPLIIVISKKRLLFVKSWIPFLVIILSYEALQGIVGVLVSNGGIVSLYAIDAPLWGFNLTGFVQTALLSPGLTVITTFLYTLHLPLVVLTSMYLWHSDRPVYKRYIYAIAVTSYCALVTFLLFPTAPPWYEGVAKDLLQGINSAAGVSAYANLMSLIEADKFAAFPSLHAAYAIVFLYYMWKHSKRFGMFAIPVTVGILFSTIYLGQHYIIDLIGGATYSLAACLLVDWLTRRYRSGDAEGLSESQADGPRLRL